MNKPEFELTILALQSDLKEGGHREAAQIFRTGFAVGVEQLNKEKGIFVFAKADEIDVWNTPRNVVALQAAAKRLDLYVVVMSQEHLVQAVYDYSVARQKQSAANN